MIKQITIALILLIGLSGSISALTDINISTIQLVGNYGDGVTQYKSMQNTQGIVGNYTLYASYSLQAYHRWTTGYDAVKSTIQPAGGTQACDGNNNCGDGTYAICGFYTRGMDAHRLSVNGNGYMNGVCDASSYACLYMQLQDTPGDSEPVAHGFIKAYIIYTDGNIYTISGTTGCLNNVSLYYDNSSGWDFMGEHNVTNNYYSFNVTSGIDFKLIFDDGHSYEFNVTDDNIVYDYNGCITTKYNFTESCGNLIPNSEGFYIEKIGSVVHDANNFYAPSGILTILQSPADNIYVSANPFFGEIGWFLDSIVNDTTYTLTNPAISWSLKVIVQNASDGSLINDAQVKVDQDCYCTSGYSTRQKKTVNGMAQFGDMSLQDASLFVMKYGYKICDENSTGYSAFLSGRSNFSSKTWLVKLAPSTSNNSSTFYEVNNKVDIHFRDINGNRTSKILDTDANVYLYYENNNTENEAMTLNFHSSSTHILSWNIPHDEIGHKTIANTYFTPYDYSYRAVIYNSSIYGWNITIPLTVRNTTKEDEQHYQNLTTNLWFMYADDGKVDYRDDMKVAIHAQSNNITLMTMDVELWIDGVYSGCKNLTEIDFANADYPYYYVWNPVFDYVSGSNYLVRMYGFDRTLLETDYVDCIADNTTRKNKLTVIVKNQDGINIDNTYIYLEEYGSTATGSNYYASFEGLDNGYYRFKATKPDYTGAGWSDITISDDDEIVTYILSWVGSGSDSTIKQQKMDDTTLRNLYIPLMMLLLILIVFGGFKSVI